MTTIKPSAPAKLPAPRASVVIITKNQRAYLEKSLPVLLAQTSGPIEIIVVDSGSTDGAQVLVRQTPGARLVEIPGGTFNYARAHNAGAAAASGKFLVRLSGDAIPIGEAWLDALLAPFADPGVAVTWGRQVFPPNTRNLLEAAYERVTRPNRPDAAPIYHRRLTTPLGCNMATRRRLWAAHPYEETLPQAEDYAFFQTCLRRKEGVGVYVASAPVLHGHNESVFRALRRSLAQSVLQAAIRARKTKRN